ncbi:hypothetical protein D3C87_98820 [compost metagenome]
MRHALTGYSFQHDVAFLFLTKMDVERQIKRIEIEAIVDHQFDDLHLKINDQRYYLQIKDFSEIDLCELEEKNNSIKIGKTWHKLSKDINIIFFKEIRLTPNDKILGLDAFKHNNVYIISMNRQAIAMAIANLYHINERRESIILTFLKKQLDKRVWDIDITDLPSIPLFKKELLERTINVGRKKLISDNILFIEGLPGVGKSHYVNELKQEYRNALIYRFWINNQDKNREKRLEYNWFLFDVSKELFGDQKRYTESQIITKLKKSKKTIIIDGLDHVENYNLLDLQRYISFITKISKNNKTIILSRPLVKKIIWPKHFLSNWNRKQTETVLNTLYFITDYKITSRIFKITKGYPILIKYIAEHYKKTKTLPEVQSLNSIEEYYGQLIEGNKGIRPFALFLCSNAYYMRTEISTLLENEYGKIVLEFIDHYPYLFEIQLNRIAVFHDSFTTYLRKRIGDYTEIENRICNLVFTSILNGENRYLSRINSFNIDIISKSKIFKQYSTLPYFEKILSNTLDIEALKSFYEQLQESIPSIELSKIDLETLYDLSLILNILNRDHISTSEDFLYTYLKYLLFAGYTEEDLTSNESLFAMFVYIETGNDSLLYNLRSDNDFDTSRFVQELKFDINKEENYFDIFNSPLSSERIKKLVEDKYDEHTYDRWRVSLSNLYLFDHSKEFHHLKEIISNYVDKNDDRSILHLESYFLSRNFSTHQVRRILRETKELIFSLGYKCKTNDYVNLNFRTFLVKHKCDGSFTLYSKTLNYIRLALYEKRKIDIHEIHIFWSQYYNRHDYSLINIADALPIFEEKGFIDQNQSIELISDIQTQSEKGYRGILLSYIENKPYDILDYIEDNFYLDELNIDWFLLDPKYLNYLPDSIFEYGLHELLRYHRNSEIIEIRDISNVLDSKRADELLNQLTRSGYKIRLNVEDKKHIKFLKKKNACYVTFEDEDKYRKETSRQRFLKGILMDEDLNFVKRNIKFPSEVAKYRDDYYTALNQLELYKGFDKELVKKELKQIFINALSCKDKDSKYFGRVYYFPGNVIKMIKEYDPQRSLTEFYQSFKRYIELSSFEI